MTDKEKQALENVKGQIKTGYIDYTYSYIDELEFSIVKKAVELYEQTNLQVTQTNMANEEKEAISRLTNIAQEKNANWLGLSNIKAIETVLNLVEKQDKLIDKMSEQLAGIAIWNNHKEQPLILGSKEEVIEYYERKVEENYDG